MNRLQGRLKALETMKAGPLPVRIVFLNAGQQPPAEVAGIHTLCVRWATPGDAGLHDPAEVH